MSNAKGMRPTAVESSSHYRKYYIYDANGNVTHLMKADIGTETTSSGWQIKKFLYDAEQNVYDEVWADGDDAFDNIADNYLTYSYS